MLMLMFAIKTFAVFVASLLHLIHTCVGHVTVASDLNWAPPFCIHRWMNPRQGNPAGWEVNSGVAQVGSRLIMLSGYLRARRQSASGQPLQPRPRQPSSQWRRLRQRLEKPHPPHRPPIATGPILAPRESSDSLILSHLVCGQHFKVYLLLKKHLFPYECISSWPSNTTSQSESEGWDAWPSSSSSANQNPSLSVPSAQLRQRSAFTPATMTTGSSPSPVLGQVVWCTFSQNGLFHW